MGVGMSQEETTKEFKKFQSFVYLDWNVIFDLAPVIKPIEGKIYKTEYRICELLGDYVFDENYCFPYSIGHIQDITRGSGEKHLNHETNAIKLLHKISRGWKISEDRINNENARVDKFYDLFEDTKESRETQSFISKTQDLCWSFMKPGLEVIKNNQNQINPNYIFPNEIINSWEDFIKFSFNFLISNPIEKDTKISKNIPSMSKKDIIQFINNKLEKSNYPFKTIEEYERVIAELNFNKNISKFSSKVNNIVNLCDIVGLTHETNNHTTFPHNLLTDTTTHLTFGLRADAFFTKDIQLKYKAIICKILLDLPVKIFHVKNDECILYR